MATTHARILTILQEAAGQEPQSEQDLSSAIRNKRHNTFRMRGDGTDPDHFMKVTSIVNLIKLAVELNLLQDRNGTISVTERGQRCLASDDAFDRQIRSSVKSYLEDKSLPLDVIVDTIEDIELPDVPDAQTIYGKLPDNRKREVTADMFRRILFLYACADGIDRKMRVHYIES